MPGSLAAVLQVAWLPWCVRERVPEVTGLVRRRLTSRQGVRMLCASWLTRARLLTEGVSCSLPS